MTGPNYEKPDIAVSQEWSSPAEGGATTAAQPPAAWWTTLNDPVLDSLIERAVTANLDLQIAASRVREARAARGIVGAALLPTAGVTAGWTLSRIQEPEISGAGRPPISASVGVGATGLSRSVTISGDNLSVTRSTSALGTSTSLSGSPGGGGGGFDRTNDLFSLGFDASWELDVFGGNQRAIEAADATIEATDERRRDLMVSLMSEVALNYIELRAAQSRLDITHRNIAAQQNSVEITAERFRIGLNSDLDRIRAEALLNTTQSQVPLLEQQVETSMHRLAVLLGEEPGALKDELRPAVLMPAAPETVPVGLPSDLLRRRSDIRAAERELAAATARIGEATADLFPKFFLTGGISGQSGDLGGIFNDATRVLSIGPGISWPIFQGGAIRANIEVQNERQEQAAIGYEQSILIALEDVENGLVSFAKEQERRTELAEAVAANEAAVAIANERYITGLDDFLNVISAQQQLFQTQDQLVQSQSFVLFDLIALYKALGGGWEVGDTIPQSPRPDNAPN